MSFFQMAGQAPTLVREAGPGPGARGPEPGWHTSTGVSFESLARPPAGQLRSCGPGLRPGTT